MNLNFCPNKKSKEFLEMASALGGEDKAYFFWMRNNGNHLEKAPNGADSKLFSTLLDYFEGNRTLAIRAKAKVYTDEFFNWFGNWINDPANASKVVDENGEPLVVYHGTTIPFNIFDKSKQNSRFPFGLGTDAFYFTSKRENAEKIAIGVRKGDFLINGKPLYKSEYPWGNSEYISEIVGYKVAADFKSLTDGAKDLYSKEVIKDYFNKINEPNTNIVEIQESTDNVMAVFLNIKDMSIKDYEGKNLMDTSSKEFDNFVNNSKEGGKLQNIEDGNMKLADTYFVKEPNQIKSAVANKQDVVTEESGFSTTDDNIYNNRGESTSTFEEESLRYYEWLAVAKNRLSQAPLEEQSIIKDLLLQEFNSLEFKHFEIHPMYSKPGNRWYLATRNSMDRKDIQDLRELAKKIGYTKLGVHEFTDKQLETLLRYLFSQVNGESEHMRNVMNVLWYALKNRTIKIEFVENSYKDSPAYYNHETGTIVMNINGAFVNSNGYSNIAAQTLLHELLHAVTVDTIKHSPDLRKQLQTLFNKVKQSAGVAYNGQENAYGFTDMYEFLAELSNEDFVKTLQNIHTGSDKSVLLQIYDLLKNVASKVLSSVFKKYRGTAYAEAMDVFVKAALPEGFSLNLLSQPQDELTIFNMISTRQQAAEAEAKRILVRMNVLYREYEKIKSKTPSLERIANSIFETLNELKQHMDVSSIGIALQQARLTLGQYDPTTNGPASMSRSNVYLYLYDKEQQGFSGVTPNQLVDMYRNSIKFYQDLINDIPTDREIDLSREDKDSIEELKTLISTYIIPLWTDAIVKVGDDIVDQQVDLEVEASDLDKEDMKRVAKDWLHKNIMYGDLNVVSSYIYNYSYSSNPIIKLVFHLIQHAEQLTLEEMHHIAPKLIKAYQDANSGIKSWTPGWQSMMMEFDDEGKPTGYFVRALNYGQYEKDLKNFREELNNEFLDKYKFTYVTDDTGTIVNSLTGEYAEDEEWGPNGEMPKYIEYQRAIEMFKGPRVFRRYTIDYYLERLTRPYDGTIDPLDPMFKDTRFNHGLSPKTLKRYNYYHSNINYYLNKCQDPDTGLIYPERLSKDDRFSLDRWNQRFDDFKSIFNPDGSYKSGEDLRMAYEVRAWLKWIGQKTDSKRYQDLFNDEMTRLYQEGVSSGDMSKYNTFMRYNASVGINPDYVKQTVGTFKSSRSETDLSHKALLLRKALQDMVKSPLLYSRKLDEMESNPLFWLHCKSSDLAIDDAKKPDDSGWSPGQVETFLKSFYDREILYVNPNGNYLDENGNAVSPNTPLAKSLEEAGKLQTFRQHLINVYTNQALTTGFVNGLIDESTGLHIDFSGMSLSDIRTQIINLLSYRKRIFHKDGSVTEEYAPLSIFSMLTPTSETFFNTRTGRTERTIVYLGEGRFKESYSTFSTSKLDFDPNEGVSEKPNAIFDSGRYDNSEAYNKVVKNSAVKNLYDKLILTMIDSLDIYSTNRKFNYRLPQINARTTSLFSRLIKRGYTEKSLSAIWNSMNNIEENDDGMRTKDDYFVGVDGEIANDVPLKFIRNLKNPEDISTDLVSSVIMFADMATNYKNKQAIDSVLKVLRYNMEDATRTTNKKKYVWFGENVKSNEQSIKMFDSMMNSHMYGNQWVGKNKEGGPSKAKIATFKTVDAFLSLESAAMLGLNMFSMWVGFADSLTRIFSESLAGKYMTPGDCLFALGKCLWYTPACIKNMFNPLANNKLTALMQMNGISKGVYGIYTKADWGKGRKLLSNLLMGGWSMLDWMANALLMTAFYHNIRFYDGGIIPTGFYSKYELQQEFLKAGHTKAEANYAHHNWGNFGRRVTLWDAYYFKNGEAYVRPEYEQYVTLKIKTRIATKTKKRGALYNGMNPDNDVPQWKRDVIGRLVGALRSWIFLQFQHLFAGGTDNVVREFEDVDVYETTSSGTRKKTKSKKVKLTDELRNRRFAWDYESGTPQDQIIVGIGRSIRTLQKKIISWCKFLKSGAKFSEVEKYAVKDAIIFLAMLSLMMVGWTYVHDWAREVIAPKNRQEAGPMSMLNAVDYYNYIKDYYIPREYWRLGVDDIYFRTVESKISNIDPFLVSDIVNAATALKSGLDDQLSLIGFGMDIATGDEDINTELKQGAYKYYTKGERTMYRAVGPIKNMHTFLTYEGATNNLRWYTNKFGKFYRFAGYDFKKKDNDKDRQGSNFRLSGGNLSGGNLVGGNLSGGGF